MDKYIEEIHRIRREHEEEMKGKTWEEWKQSVLAEAEAFLGRKITLRAGEESPKKEMTKSVTPKNRGRSVLAQSPDETISEPDASARGASPVPR